MGGASTQETNRPRVGVVGASGYSGIVATRLLARHPSFALAFCTSDRWAGQGVEERTGARSSLAFVSNDEAIARARDVDAVLLATSADVSHALAPELLSRGVRVVIDLSGAFRLGDVAAYPRWYKLEHAHPKLLADAWYGLPEIFGKSRGPLIANPGCYPTAAALPVAPLLREKLIEPDVIVDGKSGVTGAGRQSKEDYSFVEVDDDVRAYKILAHQHTPEIARTLSRVAGVDVAATFTAHLIPVRRGLICTTYARANGTAKQIDECLRAAYAKTPFVQVVKPEEATLARVVGTNLCAVGVACDDRRVVAVGAIDNLIKGAAGQAVQNLNLAFDLDETLGLDALHRSTP
jgi:N-acetyl-gamma-glutamyl-phosphate reductase